MACGYGTQTTGTVWTQMTREGGSVGMNHRGRDMSDRGSADSDHRDSMAMANKGSTGTDGRGGMGTAGARATGAARAGTTGAQTTEMTIGAVWAQTMTVRE